MPVSGVLGVHVLQAADEAEDAELEDSDDEFDGSSMAMQRSEYRSRPAGVDVGVNVVVNRVLGVL